MNILKLEVLQEIIQLLPGAWQYPEVAGGLIILEGQKFPTRGFRESVWVQSADILVHGERKGEIKVSYSQQRPGIVGGEGPFQLEERHLLDAIAERLGGIIERFTFEKYFRI